MAKNKFRDTRLYPNPYFDSLPNLAWRKNFRALSEDWESGELSDDDFFEAILDAATPATAAGALEAIGEKAARFFDHWFTALHGSSFNLGTRDADAPGTRSKDFEAAQRFEAHWYQRQRVVEAFHRAVLERREIE